MKKLNFIFLICSPFLFQSCQGQNLDLEKLSLPIKGDDLKTLKLSSSGAGIGTQEVQYTSYVPDADKSIGFGDVVAPKSASSSESLVRFFSKKKEVLFRVIH
ncbi:hypothetical protein [Pedobacter sp. D749]|uniref:hypothetical protein n=1 Tax=Pedobacter sp. D749 TaxID=2856523 RepID=UPI001C579C21|nr:hypothetical protein [Pedobacter sp. D749]QXU41148.1 hypothetical protein KYH19_19430 [Pedobacter sp. D749]